MNFRVTKQYSRAKELLICEFNALTDANIFVTEKLFDDTEKNIELIYRLYDDALLIKEVNLGNISVTFAQYAEGNVDISHLTQFNIRVMFQPEGRTGRINIANFNSDQDAYLFVVGKCRADATVSDYDLFIIFKDKCIIDTLNRIILANRKRKSPSFAERELSTIFYPNPLQMTLKPPGFPKDHWVEKIKD